jgi:hypothetical protein
MALLLICSIVSVAVIVMRGPGLAPPARHASGDRAGNRGAVPR